MYVELLFTKSIQHIQLLYEIYSAYPPKWLRVSFFMFLFKNLFINKQ